MSSDEFEKKIFQKREELLGRIAKRFKVPIEVKLVPQEEILEGADGCYEGDVIKIKKSMPLFWQLIVLEHEIGHFLAQKQGVKPEKRKLRVYRQKQDDIYEKEEIEAWNWVESHTIRKDGYIDQEIQKYLRQLQNIFFTSSDITTFLRLAFWF